MNNMKPQEERKPKNIILNLSDNESDQLCLIAAQKGISPEKLLEDFIGNLVDVHNRQESNESRLACRLANEYLDRACYAYKDKDVSFLQWLANSGDLEGVIENLDKIANSDEELDFTRVREGKIDVLYQKYQTGERYGVDKEYTEELLDVWDFVKRRDRLREKGV